MRRSDLVVGAELFYRRSPHYSPNKVKVVAVEPHRRNLHWYNHASTVPQFIPTDKGNMVLVEMPSPFDGTPRKILVPLARLLGPWEECNAAYEAQRKASAESNQRAQEARDANADRADRLVKAFAAAGIQAAASGWADTQIMLTLDEADRVMATLAAVMRVKVER